MSNPDLSDKTEPVMNGLVLQAKLDSLRKELRELHRRRIAARVLVLTALAAVVLTWVGPWMHWPLRSLIALFGLFLVLAGLISTWWARRMKWSDVELARMVERQHPDLDALLLTAVERLDDEERDLLRERLFESAAEFGARQDWTRSVTQRPMRRSAAGLIIAGIACTAALVFMVAHQPKAKRAKTGAADAVVGGVAKPAAERPVVTPGDTEVEQGSRLVVEARFGKVVPEEAALVVTDPDGTERERIAMRLTIDQQVFGGLITRVDKDAKYRVEYGGQRSDEYSITTFVYPKLERADVRITPPAYSGLPPKEIKNTLKVTALEQSKLEFEFRINKPVKDAELYGQDKTILPLKPKAGDATCLTGIMNAEKSQKWRLHLVDDKERANKNPPWITVTVQANQLARIDVVFPKRDIQVSSLQELPVEAKVWDDLGVTRSGASFSLAGKTKEVEFKLGTAAPAKKEDVKALLALEREDAEPRQLVSYYFWAEDKGPKGEVRRAMSDMFFADVRYFEDIYHEAEAPPGEPGGPQKAKADKLIELQKQVVNANWRLIRDTQAGRSMEAAASDIDVVRQSQQIALDQTKEAMEEVKDSEVKTFLTEAWKSMKDALDPLGQAADEKKKASLNQALTFEQGALEWLYRAQSREHQVMQQKRPSQGQGKQANENQLMNLELKQQEQRYEQEKQAGEEQTAEQQENLQVLSRLKELARRQEALAQKMKELQTQLAQAKTEEERNELENQLQRLQDEQEQLLRDLDDLKDRMEKPENAANMAEAKDQLEKTREKVADAAESLKQQKIADATNSATRAQRELEKMQEDFRQKTAKRFADEMKQMRDESRAAEARQKQISEALENQKTEEPGSDAASSLKKMLSGGQVAKQIEEQQEKLKELLENMRRISEEAEGNNPLLHRHLYEAVRDAATGGLEENLQTARDQARYGRRSDAQEAERKAAASVEQLRKGVEKAAESVLGSETDALRMARNELNKLLDEVRGEEAESGKQNTAETRENQDAAGSAQKDRNKPGSGEAKNEVAGSKSNQEGNESGEGGAKPEDEDKGQAGAEPAGSLSAQPNKKDGSERTASAQGKGDQPGQPKPEGEGKGPPQGQQAQGAGALSEGGKPPAGRAKSPGQQEGPGEGKGSMAQGAGGDQPGKGNAQQPAKDGEQPGQQGQGGRQSGLSNAAQRSGQQSGGGGGGGNLAGDDRRNNGLPNNRRDKIGAFFFDEAGEAEDKRPLSGSGYDQWSDRLRNVGEMLSQPELRNDAARILDNARAMHFARERNNLPPQADHLQTRITQPLVELRDRVAEELAKRDAANPAVPVDRDPVPPEFRELVKRYYTELGAGK